MSKDGHDYKRQGQKGLAIAALMAFTLVCASIADDNNSDDRWQAQHAKYDLQDREKLLLKADDDLGRQIYDIKQRINALHDALDASQSERDRVRHELIIVRVKLLH
jgi:hypothetical protein